MAITKKDNNVSTFAILFYMLR